MCLLLVHFRLVRQCAAEHMNITLYEFSHVCQPHSPDLSNIIVGFFVISVSVVPLPYRLLGQLWTALPSLP